MKIWSVSVVMCLVLALGCSTPPKTVTSNESFAITLTHPLHLGGHEYRTISPADVPKLRQLAVTNMWESNLAVAADTLTLTDPNNSHVMVRTVAEYDQIITKGYFAKTEADIRHEAQFSVASAVLKVMEKAAFTAKIAQTSSEAADMHETRAGNTNSRLFTPIHSCSYLNQFVAGQ